MHRSSRRPPKEPRIVSCYHCNYSTKIKSNLQKHITNVHVLKRGVPREKHFSCPMCDFSTTRVKMFDHYSQEHQVPISKSVHNFSTLEDFRAWKMKIEREETSRYIVLKGVSKLKSCNVWYYRCHRDGFFNSKGTGKRNLKVKGTNKINGCCPSEMKVTEDSCTGNVQVHFVDTHVGHSKDLSRLPLLKEDKDRIAEKLALKVPLHIVLDEIQNSKSEEQKLERIHLITRKDVLNIASSYKLKNDRIRRSVEGVSEEMEEWIKLIQQETEAVRLYKAHGVVDPAHPQLNKLDFVLIIYNNAQLEYLKTYGRNCVCFDRTHQRGAHDFELTSVLVVDELRQGFPCAFMLSNRVDSEIMSIFLNNLTSSLGGPLECRTFMSDVSDMYYVAWCSAMGVPSYRFFTSWQVDRAWRKLLTKIKISEKRAYAYKIVKTLMMEKCRDRFGHIMTSAMSDLKNDPDTSQYGELFEKEFGSNYMCWADCYRLEGYAEVNTPIEAMSKSIRNVFLQGKKCKRLDKSLMELMKHTRDNLYDRSIIAFKGNFPKEIVSIQKRHAEYMLSISADLAFQKSENGWRVITSPTAKPYDVVPNNLACSCSFRCEQCRMCFHSYKCSCVESEIDWNVCKHIHFVASSVSSMTAPAAPVLAEPPVQPPIPPQPVAPKHHHHQAAHQQQPLHVRTIQRIHTQQIPIHNHVIHLQQPQHVQMIPQIINHVPNKIHGGPVEDDRSMEVLEICESNVTQELEDLLLKQFIKPEEADSALKQAKNNALKLVQDIFDAVETRAQLDIFTNAILPVLPTITAMKYAGCNYK